MREGRVEPAWRAGPRFSAGKMIARNHLAATQLGRVEPLARALRIATSLEAEQPALEWTLC
jgi:hypothetical protein